MGFLTIFSKKTSRKSKSPLAVLEKDYELKQKAQALKDRKKISRCTSGSETTIDASNSSFTSLGMAGRSNERVVEYFLEVINKHGTLEEMLPFFDSPKVQAKFGRMSTSALDFVMEIRNCYNGFEDLKFDYESIEVMPNGEVLVGGFVMKGTHTKDLKYGTSKIMHPSDEKATRVVLQPQILRVGFNEDRISQLSFSGLTGPPGMYVAVGGVLPDASLQRSKTA